MLAFFRGVARVGAGLCVVVALWASIRLMNSYGSVSLHGVLVVAGIVLALACWRASKLLAAMQVTRATVEHASLDHANRFEANGRPAALLMLVVLGFASGGAWVAYMAFVDGDLGVASTCAVLTIGVMVFGAESVRQALRPGPLLAMDFAGIEHASFGRIPWSDVIGLRLLESKVRFTPIHTLQVGVRRPQRYLEGTPWMMRLRKRHWTKTQPQYGHFDVPLNALDQRAALIHEAAMRFRKRDKAPFAESWSPTLEHDAVDLLLGMASREATATDHSRMAVYRRRELKKLALRVAAATIAIVALFVWKLTID